MAINSTHERQCIFGEIIEDKLVLNELGLAAECCWLNIPLHFPNVALDEFIIMPNHIHGVLNVTTTPTTATAAKRTAGMTRPGGTANTVGSIIRGFKVGVTKWVRRHTSIQQVWQRNYWDRVIRSAEELEKIREYIQNNPLRWSMDRLNPQFDSSRLDSGGERYFAPTITPSKRSRKST